MERTTILLPPALRERAGLLARERGLSLAELIRSLLAEAVAASPESQGIDPLYADDALWPAP
jgi:hypothetical protein